jgi:hypothetical protein
MDNEIILFKLMNVIVYLIVIALSIIAGILVYTGLSTKAERLNYRIRLSSSIEKSRIRLMEGTKHSKAENQLRRAQYPLGLNGFRYYLLIHNSSHLYKWHCHSFIDFIFVTKFSILDI